MTQTLQTCVIKKMPIANYWSIVLKPRSKDVRCLDSFVGKRAGILTGLYPKSTLIEVNAHILS